VNTKHHVWPTSLEVISERVWSRKALVGVVFCVDGSSRAADDLKIKINMKIKHLSILLIISVFVFSGISLAQAQSDVFTQNLYYGLQNNSQVTQLQEFLTSQGLYSGPITGNFYSLTLNAVRAFQVKKLSLQPPDTSGQLQWRRQTR